MKGGGARNWNWAHRMQLSRDCGRRLAGNSVGQESSQLLDATRGTRDAIGQLADQRKCDLLNRILPLIRL
jgi:hypothetical protein